MTVKIELMPKIKDKTAKKGGLSSSLKVLLKSKGLSQSELTGQQVFSPEKEGHSSFSEVLLDGSLWSLALSYDVDSDSDSDSGNDNDNLILHNKTS